MNNETEILPAKKVDQSNIETKIYDQNVQFYNYDGLAKREPENRSGKRFLLTGSLIILGGFFLFGSLSAAFYYLPSEIFHTAAVNQFEAKSLKSAENGDVSLGKNETQQSGSEIEKSLKSNLSEDNFVKKELVNQTETKLSKTNELTEKRSASSVNSKELPKPISTNMVDSTPKTTHSNFSKQSIQNNEMPTIQKEENRQSLTNFPTNNVLQNRQTPRQIDSRIRENSGGFRDFSPNRRELFVKKIKQTNPEQRSKFIDRLQNRRRKN